MFHFQTALSFKLFVQFKKILSSIAPSSPVPYLIFVPFSIKLNEPQSHCDSRDNGDQPVQLPRKKIKIKQPAFSTNSAEKLISRNFELTLFFNYPAQSCEFNKISRQRSALGILIFLIYATKVVLYSRSICCGCFRALHGVVRE